MMWQVCLLPQCLATLKALCFHQPGKGKGQLQKILPPCKAAKASSKQAMLFLSRPWKYVENLSHGFCGDTLLASGHEAFSLKIFSLKWNWLHGQRLDLEATFWRHWIGTVAILAQDTHGALAVKQAFLQNWPRFDSSRAHVCVMMWQICLFPQCFATWKALCFHQPEKGKGQLKKILPPCKATRVPPSKQCFFFPGPGNMWKTCAVAFVGKPCWSFRAWGVLSDNLFPEMEFIAWAAIGSGGYLLKALGWHRSHFGSRYTLSSGCKAGLFAKLAKVRFQ